MRAQPLTYLLVVLSALFAGFGALLDLWFYAVAGIVLALYLLWRFLAFQSVIASLQLLIRRNIDKTVVRRGGRVNVEVSISSRVPVKGLFSDTIPVGVELVDGTNRAQLSLRADEKVVLRYALVTISRETVSIEHSSFTLNNGLFSHTIQYTAAAREVKQPPYAVSVEGGAGGAGGARGAPGATSTSVQALYRQRRAHAGMELAYIRPFEVGDSLKRIHWKASAKLNKLMTKEFLADLDDAADAGASVSLIIDQGGMMGRGPAGATELDFAVNVADYFVTSAVARGSRVGLVTYDDSGVRTNLAADASLPHVSGVVRALNEMEPATPLRRPRTKMDVTGSDVLHVKQHFAATPEADANDDIRRFRHIISYLYAHSEGYVRNLHGAPAFRAITTTLKRARGRSTLVLVSDLESDFSPLSEGIRLASRRGMRVYVIALFSKVFEESDDPLFEVEDVYAAYEAHRRRVRKLEGTPNVKVIEANAAEALRPSLQEARIA
ncbi:MAG: DUF58 domain-containing protein [Halobacteriota archaeon]